MTNLTDTDGSVVSLTGDADLVYHAPVDVLRSDDPFKGLLDDNLACQQLQTHLNHTIEGWHRRPLELESMVRGQSVLRASQLPNELASVFELDNETREAVETALRTGFHKAGLACADHVQLDSATVFLFASISMSIRVHLRIADGWGAHADDLLSFFGPEARRENKASRVITDVLRHGCDAAEVEQERLAGPVTRLCRGIVSALEMANGRERIEVLATVPYYHILYVGTADAERPGTCRLADPFSKLLYLAGPELPRSQSPQIGEFAFLGDAYSIIAFRAMDDGVDYTEAVAGVSSMIQICEFQYRQLAMACDALQEQLGTEPAKGTFLTSLGRLVKQLFWPNTRLEMLYTLERSLQVRFDELTTPTFSRNNRILRLRDALLRGWGLSALHVRANNLIGALRTEEARQRDRLAWGMNVALFLIALLAVLEAVDSAFGLYDKLAGK